MGLPGFRSGRAWRRRLSSPRGFARLQRAAPRSRAGRFLLVWTDLLLVNLLFYALVRALIFHPLGYTAFWQIALPGLLLAAVLYASHGLLPWQNSPSLLRVSVQAFLFLACAAGAAALSAVVAVEKGTDWSWLRPEVIKVPLWMEMFVSLSPGFTVLFLGAVSLCIWWALRSPRSRFLPVLPTLAALALAGWIVHVLLPFQEVPAGSAAVATPGRQQVVPVFLAMFAGPAALFSVLLWVRWFPMAFRVVPLMFHMVLMVFHYTGVLPGPSAAGLLSGEGPGTEAARHDGVSFLYPPAGEDPDPSFLFLRKMAVSGRRIYVNYGPTCGLYAIDRQSGASRRVPIPGTMRDLALTPGGRSLYGLNWYGGDLLGLNPETLSTECSLDLFGHGLRTPYSMILDGERLFVSNVTFPVVAEFSRSGPWDRCAFRLERSIDLHRTGYLPFTDGTYGMHLDAGENRLYVVAGFVEDRNLSSLVEIDLETFSIRRTLNLTAADPIFPLRDRRSVLIPSYFTRELHEVSLDRMEIVRTLRAGPNIVSLEHDPGRGLFYALSRACGLLLVIDDASGETVLQMPVGHKPEPLHFDTEADQLLVGSGLGILKVDLIPFLGVLHRTDVSPRSVPADSSLRDPVSPSARRAAP